MSTLIVEVSRIDRVLPHPNADLLELAQIKGWQCVVPKGKYAAGALVTYVPIDAVLPVELSERLGVTKYLSNGRVRCAKLRGEPSFGLVMDREDPAWPEGTDVREHYGITKYVPPLKPSAGDAAEPHPLFVSYTDVENLRNFPAVFADGGRAGRGVERLLVPDDAPAVRALLDELSGRSRQAILFGEVYGSKIQNL